VTIRILRWVGLAQPSDADGAFQRLIQWIGLPANCVLAVICSGLLFGAIHLGKDPRELLLSVPGGIALAYVAFRTNSWLVPFALHLMTAGTAFLILLMRQ
jgi:membrane protease YdiL (CAAX protease family)